VLNSAHEGERVYSVQCSGRICPKCDAEGFTVKYKERTDEFSELCVSCKSSSVLARTNQSHIYHVESIHASRSRDTCPRQHVRKVLSTTANFQSIDGGASSSDEASTCVFTSATVIAPRAAVSVPYKSMSSCACDSRNHLDKARQQIHVRLKHPTPKKNKKLKLLQTGAKTLFRYIIDVVRYRYAPTEGQRPLLCGSP
jgi:hypothetical protein